jgi:ornithine cyclodeaminase/alanine dehydrogenase-like protein (mu-crystallin family)
VVNVTSNPPVLSVKANLRPEAGGAAGLVVAFDPDRYTVRAVLDSADITAMRTGAIAAVAARQLAGPGPRRLALLGAGPVARQSLAALSQVVELEQVRVWSRSEKFLIERPGRPRSVPCRRPWPAPTSS